MPDSDLSLIKFGIYNYFSVLLNHRVFEPVSTLQLKLVESLINSESIPDKDILNRLNWINSNTHKDVMENLSIVELLTFRNIDKGVSKEVEINNKTFTLAVLYNYLDEVSKELTQMVIKICKKYNVDMVYNAQLNSTGKISFV
jgi:hypothetical protein